MTQGPLPLARDGRVSRLFSLGRPRAGDHQHPRPHPRAASIGSSPIVAGAAVLCASLLLNLLPRVNHGDEAWFLQVASRVASGEVLYRDVFYGATPLSAYLGAAGVWLFGAELWVVRGLGALILTASVLLFCCIGRQLGMTRWACLVGASLVLAYPLATVALYTPLAYLLLLACFSITLEWIGCESVCWERASIRSMQGRPRREVVLALAGAAAGLCFSAKQNVGVFALAALGLAVVTSGTGQGALLRNSAFVLASFCVAAAVVLAPVVVSGGFGGLWDYGFANKSSYVRIGYLPLFALPYQAGYPARWSLVLDGLKLAHIVVPALLPLVTTIALVAVRLTGLTTADGRRMAVHAFVGAALAGTWPRPATHLWYAVPVLLLGVYYAWRARGEQGYLPCARVANAVVVLCGGATLGARVALASFGLVIGKYQVSTLPHFHGLLIDAAVASEAHTTAATLRGQTTGGRPFLLLPEAHFYYLVADLKDPTPFDYPVTTAFGRHGMVEVADAIVAGRVRTVCSGFPEAVTPEDPQRPAWLLAYVAEHMQRGDNLGICTVYRGVV